MTHPIQTLTPDDIRSMSYVEMISLLRETNRCPGGKDTIRKILHNTFITPDSRVLDVGSNTGFTSLEIARTRRCRVVGIDINASAVAEARRELFDDHAEIQRLVTFQVASAYSIPFNDNEFDVVIVGGATSFMIEKERAINECHRVLRQWGFLSATNLCYIQRPAQSTIDDVSEIIGVRIQPWSSDDWICLFQRTNLFELYHWERGTLGQQPDERVESHVEMHMRKTHLVGLRDDARQALRERWLRTLKVFNENHRYLGFTTAIFRKRFLPEEPELFSPMGISDH